MGKQSLPKKTMVLSASEIGQYIYCSYAWYLHRCGYEPESRFLDPGKQAHVALGNRIDDFDLRMRHAWWYAILGMFVLALAALLLLSGVIL